MLIGSLQQRSGRRLTAARPTLTVSKPNGRPYDMGVLTNMVHLWVDPRLGSDARNGSSEGAALKTLAAAWNRIPSSVALTRGYHIHVKRGTIGQTGIPNYMEAKWGTRTAPIIIEAAGGRGSVTLTAPMNVFDVSHLYIIGIAMRSQYDPFHCERCTNLLLRNFTAVGNCGGTSDWLNCGVQEAIKLNQCKGVWVENVESGWANDNALDCVAVQYGHILDSYFHHSEWGVYLKGGSAYWLVARNNIDTHGSTGFAAGQGTGFEFMTAPWLQYEAYDIKFVNNIVRRVAGAGMGAWGCYNCLYAHNTLLSVGNRSHTVEVKFGERSCDGDAATCTANANKGGWGPRTPGSVVYIPNRNVYIVNNLIHNPPGQRSEWQHLQVDDPHSSTRAADRNLVFRGNVFFNGGSDMPLGISDQACATTNPTCNPTQLSSRNAFNTIVPDINLTSLRPRSRNGTLAAYRSKLWRPIASFPAWAAAVAPGPAVPAGNLNNTVFTDRAGALRSLTRDAPGCYDPPV